MVSQHDEFFGCLILDYINNDLAHSLINSCNVLIFHGFDFSVYELEQEISFVKLIFRLQSINIFYLKDYLFFMHLT